jgi:WD40 repeat protein
MLSSKMDRAERNHQKWHKRLVIFIGHAGLVATASVYMPLAWGQMVGGPQQPAKDLAMPLKLSAAKWFAQDGVGAPTALISSNQNHFKSFGGPSTALTIGAAPDDSGRSREPLKCREGTVFRAAYSPDGSRIVSASSDGTVRQWDAKSGRAISEPLQGHQGMVYWGSYSADGSRIVSAGIDGTVRQWDAKSGRAIGEPLQDHQGRVSSASYSADGSRIVSAGNDGTVRQWDAKSGRAIGEPLQGHQDPVNSVSYSADGSRIMSAGVDGTFRLWDAKNGRSIGEPMRCIL